MSRSVKVSISAPTAPDARHTGVRPHATTYEEGDKDRTGSHTHAHTHTHTHARTQARTHFRRNSATWTLPSFKAIRPFPLSQPLGCPQFCEVKRIVRPTDVPDTGLICDLLWADPDKDACYNATLEYDRRCAVGQLMLQLLRHSGLIWIDRAQPRLILIRKSLQQMGDVERSL